MGLFGGREEMAITLNNGFQMPIIGLDVWRMKKKNEMRDLIINAINIGYRYFDCAGTLTCSFLYICNLNFFCIFKSLLVF
jgi:hypothetical protein